MKGLNPGLLNKRLVIEALSLSQDSQGNVVEDWALLKPVWAMIRPASSREMVAANQMKNVVNHIIYIHATPGVTGSCRGIHNGKVYNFSEPMLLDEEGFHWLKIPCTTDLNQG